MITDEIVWEVCAILDRKYAAPRRFLSSEVRDILEAGAPMLRAQGMLEAASMIPGGMIEKGHILSHSNPDVRAIYARAQELKALFQYSHDTIIIEGHPK